MKRWFFLIGSGFIIIGLILFLRSRFFFKKQAAGLKVSSQPQATVFLGDKHLGQTPFEDKLLDPGEYLLKLIPETTGLASWERKIKLTPGVLTTVDQKLAETQEYSSGQISTLATLTNKRLVALAVITNPSDALVKIDGITRGFSPISTEDITTGEHLITLSLSGYVGKEIRVATMEGKKLIIDAQLAKEKIEEKVEEKEATASAQNKKETKEPYVEIKDTPTGWLRVRMKPSTTATQSGQVNPGEKYPLLDEENGWYKIRYQEDQEGWISGRYATKFE